MQLSTGGSGASHGWLVLWVSHAAKSVPAEPMRISKGP